MLVGRHEGNRGSDNFPTGSRSPANRNPAIRSAVRSILYAVVRRPPHWVTVRMSETATRLPLISLIPSDFDSPPKTSKYTPSCSTSPLPRFMVTKRHLQASTDTSDGCKRDTLAVPENRRAARSCLHKRDRFGARRVESDSGSIEMIEEPGDADTERKGTGL